MSKDKHFFLFEKKKKKQFQCNNWGFFCCCCRLIHIWTGGWIPIELMGLLDESVNCFFGLILRKGFLLFLFFTSCHQGIFGEICLFFITDQNNSNHQIYLINLRYFCLELHSDASLLRVKHIFNPIIIAFALTEFQPFGTEALRKVDLQTVSH